MAGQDETIVDDDGGFAPNIQITYSLVSGYVSFRGCINHGRSRSDDAINNYHFFYMQIVMKEF